MDVNEVIDRARDSITVKRVFGEPIQQGAVTLVPAAWVSGGGGGGGGEGTAPEGAEAGLGKGFGSGFGIRARPAGAFIIREGKVSWLPVVDADRIIRRAQVVVGGLLLLVGMKLARSAGQLGKRRRRWWR